MSLENKAMGVLFFYMIVGLLFGPLAVVFEKSETFWLTAKIIFMPLGILVLGGLIAWFAHAIVKLGKKI